MTLLRKITGLAILIATANTVNAAPVANGQGTLNVSGNIAAATCSASLDQTTFAFKNITPAQITGAASNSQFEEVAFNVVLNNCANEGNSLEVTAMADSPAHSSVNVPTKAGSFTYAAAGVDQTNGPLFYRVLKGAAGGSGTQIYFLNGQTNTLDVTKGDGQYPHRLLLVRSWSSAAASGAYAGNFAGSFTYTLGYP